MVTRGRRFDLRLLIVDDIILTNTSKTKRREEANNVGIAKKNAGNLVLGLNVRIKIKFKEGCSKNNIHKNMLHPILIWKLASTVNHFYRKK
ncbi:hypothetical protein TPENAI_60220 [Tenacibaculum litopenaei]